MLPNTNNSNIQSHSSCEQSHSSCDYYQFIRECCHKMFIIDAHAEKSYNCYKNLSSKICNKNMDKYAIAAYSIYHTMKSENSQRSLKTVSEFTGIPIKMLWNVERYLISKPNPTKTSDALISKYRHLELGPKDLLILLKISDHYKERSFSPNTLAGALLYLYCCSLSRKKKLSNVAFSFQVSTMSMYRCIKYLKANEFHSILVKYCKNDDE